jgi:hypothetical protein
MKVPIWLALAASPGWAHKVSASALLAFGMAWFILRLRS